MAPYFEVGMLYLIVFPFLDHATSIAEPLEYVNTYIKISLPLGFQCLLALF
jgi:hypothetical protein